MQKCFAIMKNVGLVQTFKYSGVVFTVKMLPITKITATEDFFLNFYEKIVFRPNLYKRFR